MSISHDELVELLSRTIYNNYKNIFGDVFISNVSMDFPRPDFVYIPLRMKEITAKKIEWTLKQTTLTTGRLPLPVSFEVKTPFVYKHEYITGIGQAVCNNSIFPLSYLVVPNVNIEGFEVSNFILKVVEGNRLSIGIFTYKMDDPKNVELTKQSTIVEIKQIESQLNTVKSIKRSYSYWRETKPEEVYEALKISNSMEKSKEANILAAVLEKFWENVLSKRFPETTRKASFLLNYKLFLIQNALIDSYGRLTILGRHTLTIGEQFGKDSEIFKEAITYIILKYGGHYTLLSKIYEEQNKMDQELSSWDKWSETLAERLREQGYYISKDDFRKDLPRIPYAYERYFCGIAKNFVEGKGLPINYPKIVEILDKGSKLFFPIESTISF